MVVKRGRFGSFLACSRYPECKTTKPISHRRHLPQGVRRLHQPSAAPSAARPSTAAPRYPKCDFVTWDRPRNEACPSCGSPYLLEKFSRKTGAFVACPEKECGYRRDTAAAAGAPPAGPAAGTA